MNSHKEYTLFGTIFQLQSCDFYDIFKEVVAEILISNLLKKRGKKMIRTMDFRMSREGLMKVGDTVNLAESTLSTLAGTVYYYTIVPALAMSNNTPKRLKNLTGTVTNIVPYGSEWTVTLDIDEP